MVLAVFLDYQGWSDRMKREGLVVFSQFLMEAVLKSDPDTRIELWMNPSQKEKIENVYVDFVNRYTDRVSFYPKEIRREDRNILKGAFRLFKSFIYGFFAFASSFHKGMRRFWSEKRDLNRALSKDLSVDLGRVFNRCSGSDVVYAPLIASTGALNVNRPVFMQIHDLYRFALLDFFEKEDGRENYRKWVRHTERILNGYASRGVFFVASNGYVKTMILKYIRTDAEHCRVIHYPAMIRIEQSGRVQSETEIREKYGLGDRPYTFFPSQNRPNKNLIILLKALKRLRNSGQPVNLVTTGSMSDVRRTARYVKDNPGLVIEVGQVPEEELYPLYKYSSMVVCPNIIEGPLISEQAMGALFVGEIPVAHARSMGYETGLKEAGLDEETADLNWFDITDDEGLSEIMADMLKEPEKHVAKQKNVIKAYSSRSWEKTAKEYLSAFREAAGLGGRS